MAHRLANKRKGKSGSSGGGHSKEITEKQHDEAMNVLRAEYYTGVRSIAADIDNQKFTSQDDYEQAIHEAVDGSYWVIYTHANFQVLLCSDNHDAYSEEYGEPPVAGSDIDWAALAFAALDKDVRQTVSEPSFDEVGAREVHARKGARPDHGEQEAYGLTFTQWLAAAGGIGGHDPSMLRMAWLAGEDPAEYREVEEAPRRRRR